MAVLAAGVAVDVFYRGHLDDVFFIKGQRTADSIKAQIVDRYSDDDVKMRPTYLVIGDQDIIRGGYFKNDTFFRFYRPGWQAPIVYVAQVDDIAPPDGPAWDRAMIFAMRGDDVVDVTTPAKAVLEEGRSSQSGSRVRRLSFQDSEIVGAGRASTPTRRGVFGFMLAGPLGPVKTITIVSTFAARFRNVEIDRDAVLAFSVAMPLTFGDGARAYALAEISGQRTQIFEARLPPARGGGPSWRDYTVDLGRLAEQQVALVLGVDSPGGDATADWVAFSRVRVVSPRAGGKAQSR